MEQGLTGSSDSPNPKVQSIESLSPLPLRLATTVKRRKVDRVSFKEFQQGKPHSALLAPIVVNRLACGFGFLVGLHDVPAYLACKPEPRDDHLALIAEAAESSQCLAMMNWRTVVERLVRQTDRALVA
jgi:hypothetical protein